MDTGEGSTDGAATRFLALWARLAEGRCTRDELGELFGLLRQHLLKVSAVRGRPQQEREDILMSFLHEKLLDTGGSVRAPINLYEFSVYVGNFIKDQDKIKRPDPVPPEKIAEMVDDASQLPSALCSLDEFSGSAVAGRQSEAVKTWLDRLRPEERCLLLSVLCLGETATGTLEKLGMLGAAHLVKNLGLRLTNAHVDAHWSRSGWFKNTKLGHLFRALDINGHNDMLPDARQVLSLICRLLGVDRRTKGGTP